MKNIEARRLTERIDVLTPTTTRDEMGGEVKTYEKTWSVYAEVQNARGSRMLALGDIELIDDIVINVRLTSANLIYFSNERIRIRWQGRTYYLIAPPVTERHNGAIKISARRLSEGTSAPNSDSEE